MQLLGAVAQHGIHRAVGDEPALLVEHHGAVDEPDRRVEVVLDEQDRAVARCDQFGQRGVHLLDSPRVEIGGRLVQDEERRAHRERARDREALASATREAVGVVAAALPELHASERGLRAGEHVGHRHPQVLGTERDLVQERAGHQLRVRVLEDHADLRAQLGDGGLGGVVPADLDRPAHVCGYRVRNEAVEGQGERGLARSAGAEQEHDLARGDVEAHRCGGGGSLALVGDGEIANPEQGCGTAAGPGCLCRGGRVALECGHGSSQERY